MITIALLGAESTGKSQLADGLAQALRERGQRVHLVDECLRSWCDRHGRTPHADEQAAIAQAQTERIAAAPAGTTCVITDTTALMTAVYSDLLYDDTSLYAGALQQQRRFDATLVTGLDLPWVADGLQRDGPQARARVDARLRSRLAEANLRYQVVYGRGQARLQNALYAIDSIAGSADAISAGGLFSLKTSTASPPVSDGPSPSRDTVDPAKPVHRYHPLHVGSAFASRYEGGGRPHEAGKPGGVSTCEKCSDPECEHRLFSALVAAASLHR